MTEWEEPASLICPHCQHAPVPLELTQGSDHTWFATCRCPQCGETALLQLDAPPMLPFLPEQLDMLQAEWAEWIQMKRLHLYRRASPQSSKYTTPFLLLILVVSTSFFLADHFHTLGGFFENPSARQVVVNQYVNRLKQMSCFSDEMKEKFRNIPIKYTAESVYHHSFIQYGETGKYWGEYQIKIFRSNFWFFGWPKQSQLIETLIHEVRHRVSPGLGHSPYFFTLVRRDTACALQRW